MLEEVKSCGLYHKAMAPYFMPAVNKKETGKEKSEPEILPLKSGH
jgi:hypothetical protein